GRALSPNRARRQNPIVRPQGRSGHRPSSRGTLRGRCTRNTATRAATVGVYIIRIVHRLNRGSCSPSPEIHIGEQAAHASPKASATTAPAARHGTAAGTTGSATTAAGATPSTAGPPASAPSAGAAPAP